MLSVKTMNTIAERGKDELIRQGYKVSEDIENPDAILLRSADLHSMNFAENLLCIARAGAGTNNIPVERCATEGIVVFNAPGANAEAVKELVICEMVMASRDVLGSIEWVKSLKGRGDEIPKLVEKGKSNFTGPELAGKTIGVIGLGAVGALVANIALELDMEVYGYDPFMSVSSAWTLSREVKYVDDINEIYRKSDYISINVPFTQQTAHMLNAKAFATMKKGVRIMNESRADVVDDDAILAALESGHVAKYVTDFPNEKLIGAKNVIAMPHLGACTPESEEKCAVMAAKEIHDYLENGNIKNSVNMPNASLERMGVCRLCVLHRNVPNMISSFLELISTQTINVEHMINKARGEYAYTVMDFNMKLDDEIIEKISEHEAVLRVRML